MIDEKKKLNLMPLILNATAIGLAVTVLTMDCSAFLFWLRLGVFDGHWNDVSLQVLFVCLIISFLFFLIVAALFGLGNHLSDENHVSINILSELGGLIESGFDKAIRTSISCTMVVLALLVLFCLSFWRDLLWWSEVQRGRRAMQEMRPAAALYEASADVATNDRKPYSYMYLGQDAFTQQQYARAERYFNKAVESLNALPGDNRRLLITAYQELAQTLMKDGKPSQAKPLLREAIKAYGDPRVPLPVVRMRLLGPIFVPVPNSPPTLIGTYTLLERACIEEGNFDESQQVFIENLRTFLGFEKPNIRAILSVTELYAEMLRLTVDKHFANIDYAYKEALQLVSGKFGADSQELGRLQASYADRLKALAKYAEAKDYYAKALEHLQGLKGSDALVLRVMNNLAWINAKLDQPEAAEKLYQEAMELIANWQDKSPDVEIQKDVCQSDYANLLRSLKRFDEANKIVAPNLKQN